MQDDTANQTPSVAPLDSSLPPQENMTPMPVDTAMPTPPPFEPVTNPISPVIEPMATVPPVVDQPIAAPEATQDTGGGFPQVIDGSETPPPPPVINGGTTPTTPTFVPEKSGGKGRGKIIATIFGILLLVGGVGAGILAVQTQVLTRPKADGCDECLGSCPAGQVCNNIGATYWCPGGHFVCQWASSNPTTPPTTPPTNPTNPPSGSFTCDGLTGTHCNTDLGCHQFTCVGQNNWRDDGAGGVCCGQAACSSIPECTTTTNPTTPPGTGASCAGGTPDQQYACRTVTGQPGLGCVKCNDGLFQDVEDSTWGCPSQCYTGSQDPDTTPPPNPPTEDQYGTACQNGCCNLSTNGISNFPACAHNCWVVAYKCPGASAGIPCNSNGSVVDGQCFQANYCGSQQIDVRCESFDDTGDCAGLAPGSAISVVSIINPGACDITPTPPGQTNPPGDNPTTPPSGPTAQCLDVQAWDTDWNELNSGQLSALSAGDVVRFTVRGGASSGSFDMARFTINTVLGPEVTGTKPTTGEFYHEYTIPAGVTSFTIKGEIHHVSLGWR